MAVKTPEREIRNDEGVPSPSSICSEDGSLCADVVEEDGVKKLFVKSTSVPINIGNLVFLDAENGGSNEMNVNGSGTAVEFLINADPTFDLIINSIAFAAFDSGIKIDTFLGKNSELTNGVIVEVKSEDVVFQFRPIKTTQDFDFRFSWGQGRSYELLTASGNDSLVSRFGPSVPFLLKKQGTFASDDYIKIIIQDNLNSVGSFRASAFGAKDD